jgi:hypothetical protein
MFFCCELQLIFFLHSGQRPEEQSEERGVGQVRPQPQVEPLLRCLGDQDRRRLSRVVQATMLGFYVQEMQVKFVKRVNIVEVFNLTFVSPACTEKHFLYCPTI